MELFDIFRRRSLPDKKVALRQPVGVDVAAQCADKLLIVSEGQWGTGHSGEVR